MYYSSSGIFKLTEHLHAVYCRNSESSVIVGYTEQPKFKGVIHSWQDGFFNETWLVYAVERFFFNQHYMTREKGCGVGL